MKGIFFIYNFWRRPLKFLYILLFFFLFLSDVIKKSDISEKIRNLTLRLKIGFITTTSWIPTFYANLNLYSDPFLAVRFWKTFSFMENIIETMIIFHLPCNKGLLSYIYIWELYMRAIAGQTAGPNGLTFFRGNPWVPQW